MAKASLKTKFVLVTSLLLCGAMLGIAAVIIHRERQSLALQIETKAVQFAQLATVDIFRIFLAIHDSDQAKIDKIRAVVSANPDIRNLTIVFANRKIRFDLRNPERVGAVVADPHVLGVFESKRLAQRKTGAPDGEESLDIISPYIEAGYVFGVLRLEISLESLRALVGKRIGEILGLSSLAILLGVLVSALFARTITRPIEELARGVREVGRGRWGEFGKVTATTRDEVGELAAAFNRMVEELAQREADLRRQNEMLVQSEKVASIGRLAAGVAHEINNPLNEILAFATHLLDKKGDRGPEAEILIRIRDAGLRGRTIVKGLLDYARQSEPKFRELDAGGVVNRALSLLDHQIRLAGVEVLRECGNGLLINADENQLIQVLTNLILNALDAMPEGGQLAIRTGSGDPQWAEIVVQDTGRGMSEEVRQQAFDPFFTTKETGTGLGLAVSYGIIKAHGGTIEARGMPGGSVFTVRLPRAGRSPERLPG
jgi:signal transduction histidine kinase